MLVFDLLIRLFLFLSFLAILLSLGSLSFLALNSLQIAVSGLIVLWFLIHLLKRDITRINFLFSSFSGLIFWLIIQGLGKKWKMPLFPMEGPWETPLNLFMMFLAGVGFYLLTVETFTNRRALTAFLRWICVTTAFFGCAFIAIFYLSGTRVENLQIPTAKIPFWLLPWIGSNVQPNNLVDLFFPGIFYSLSFVLYARERLSRDDGSASQIRSEYVLYFCFMCIEIAALVLTKSRAGILAFLAALVFYFIFFALTHRKRLSRVKGLIFLLVVVFGFLLTLGMKDVLRELQSVSKTVSEEAQLKGTRALTIGASWQLVTSHWLTGVGLGQFHLGWLYYHESPFNLFPERSYNDFLWFWAETGIVGVFLFFGGMLVFFGRSFMTLVKTESHFLGYFLSASICSIFAILFHSLVDPTLYVPALLWTMFILCGAGVSLNYLEYLELEKTYEIVHSRPSRFFLAIILLCAALGAGFFSVNKLKAYAIASKADTATKLQTAAALDPFNVMYPAGLADYYEKQFRETKDPAELEKTKKWIAEGLRLDPFRFSLYLQNARLYLPEHDETAIADTFKLLNANLPDFYPGELAASAFYFNASVEERDGPRAARFEQLGLMHYRKALKIYPDLYVWKDFFPFMTEAAKTKFTELTISAGK